MLLKNTPLKSFRLNKGFTIIEAMLALVIITFVAVSFLASVVQTEERTYRNIQRFVEEVSAYSVIKLTSCLDYTYLGLMVANNKNFSSGLELPIPNGTSFCLETQDTTLATNDVSGDQDGPGLCRALTIIGPAAQHNPYVAGAGLYSSLKPTLFLGDSNYGYVTPGDRNSTANHDDLGLYFRTVASYINQNNQYCANLYYASCYVIAAAMAPEVPGSTTLQNGPFIEILGADNPNIVFMSSQYNAAQTNTTGVNVGYNSFYGFGNQRGLPTIIKLSSAVFTID